MEILWKCIASTEFWTNCTKICGNCAFPQNFHKRKLGEIMVIYAVLNKYSRRPLFRMLLISNIRYSEQNFKSLEFTLRNSYNLCCLFRTPLFRTFRYFERFFQPLAWVPSFNWNFCRKMVKNVFLFLLQLQIYQ